jgi:glycosyltransferase involved in cell wall biosynthesis
VSRLHGGGEWKPSGPRAISFLIGTLNAGGIQSSTLRLAGELARQGHMITIIVVDGRGPMGQQVPPGCELVDLQCRRIRNGLLPLVLHLRLHRPEVVISAQTFVNALAVLARRLSGRPRHLVLTERNALDALVRFQPGMDSRLRVALVRLLYPAAESVVAVSEAVAASLRDTAGLRRPVQVIHSGIDLETTRQKMSAPVEHAWLDDPGSKLILGIGRLTAQKNFALLLRAFARLTVPARLLVFGDGPERARLVALARELGVHARVEFAGFVANPLPFLARCDLFVLPSRWEGYANVILEALVCEAPIVATDCPGGPRDLLTDAARGRLVPVDDVEAMAAAMHDMLKAPRRTGSRAGVAEKLSIQVTAQKYLALLDGLR